jgi:hypothetical protein
MSQLSEMLLLHGCVAAAVTLPDAAAQMMKMLMHLGW